MVLVTFCSLVFIIGMSMWNKEHMNCIRTKFWNFSVMGLLFAKTSKNWGILGTLFVQMLLTGYVLGWSDSWWCIEDMPKRWLFWLSFFRRCTVLELVVPKVDTSISIHWNRYLVGLHNNLVQYAIQFHSSAGRTVVLMYSFYCSMVHATTVLPADSCSGLWSSTAVSSCYCYYYTRWHVCDVCVSQGFFSIY